jgi:pimeloyl-ACP methyl ester carboxylesterase
MPSITRALRFDADGATLVADLVVPDAAGGLVVFAHGTGSSRHSPRNRYVAGVLQRAGLATVLTDLLTAEEEQIDVRSGELRFDIDLLGRRVVAMADLLAEHKPVAQLPIGLFGASTGAAAALYAAAERPERVDAVVSRGGRPDLAGARLEKVDAPTLLIVGGRDEVVLDLNHRALRQLGGVPKLEVVPGATHLFEEPGALERAANLARDWFVTYLGDQRSVS